MTERDAIFARIREALRVPAAKPGAHGARDQERTGRQTGAATPPSPHGPDTGPITASGQAYAQVLPTVGNGFEEMAAAFTAASKELRTDFHVVELEAGAHILLGALRDAEGWRQIATHEGALTRPVAESLGLPVLWTDGGYDRPALERCDVGISACDFLIAQTGTVVVTSASAGGRALSVLPPHHVVLARRAQLVPDLPTAFERLATKHGDHWPSMVSFITGPSRTGDIERILVLGAHGPKKLTVVCW
jgi:L-lactate dehydrogenase complex protein LldG